LNLKKIPRADPSMKYVVYLSRSLKYTGKDDIVKKLLHSDGSLDVEFQTVSDLNPASVSTSADVIRTAVWRHMEHASVVLFLAGVYPVYKNWMDIEWELAKSTPGRKLIFIEVFDSACTSKKEIAMADNIVKMSADSMICAIKNLCSL
jgi:hypothetical protein